MSKFTPGPWVIDWNVARLDIFSSDAKVLVASLRRSAMSPAIDEAARANARLIAAAPDLLATLAEAHDIIDAIGQPETAEVAARMRAVIAKAKGGQA
jgi:hypothetical protein